MASNTETSLTKKVWTLATTLSVQGVDTIATFYRNYLCGTEAIFVSNKNLVQY